LREVVWRTVSTSPEFDQKLENHFGSDAAGVSKAHRFIIDELIPHIFQAFKENWQQLLPINPDEPDIRDRFYDYFGDIIEWIAVRGRLDAIEFHQGYSEEFITLYDFVIFDKKELLEDPEQPTPDR